ncbi:MAG TPA: metallophosphoesterase [Polyangia bacterium]|nr:metallophosphoesterase [Polyangia bacterium]
MVRPLTAVPVAVASLWLALGCTPAPLAPNRPIDAGAIEVGTPDDAGSDAATAFELVGAPLIFAPTASGFGLSVVLRSGDPSLLRARVRDEAATAWNDIGAPATPAADVAQWSVAGLSPGRRYAFEIFCAPGASAETNLSCAQPLYGGSAATARAPGAAFTFAVMADSHIEPRDPLPPGSTVVADSYGFMESTLRAVAADIASADPDFVVDQGDLLDYHLFGFNDPPPDASWARLAYLNFRRMMGDTLGRAAHFSVIGNWDGENGCNSADEIERSRSQRLLYLPGPAPTAYPQGGGPNQDYYAFTWGDALFVVLNVMTYTPTCHLLDVNPGLPDDWTLGATQLAWLEDTLANATSKWRFLFIHHTVGGNAGNDVDSAYGRGGGRAAYVGEQAVVHDLMMRHGVQVFFYGHDHVFTDMVVDGIHYTLPGSAGAPWKFDSSETGYTNYWPDSGYGRVSVSPDGVTVDFVAMGGTVLASYVLP